MWIKFYSKKNTGISIDLLLMIITEEQGVAAGRSSRVDKHPYTVQYSPAKNGPFNISTVLRLRVLF